MLMPHVRVQNVISQIDGPPRGSVAMSAIKYLMFHRTMSHDLDWYKQHMVTPDAKGCNKFYQSNDEARAATGGRFPYSIVLGQTQVWQTRRLTDATPHARAYSDGKGTDEAIGVACIGDFRFLPPPMEPGQQWTLAVDLAAGIVRRWPWIRPVGHDEVPGACAPGKSCPGKFWDMNLFRAEVQAVNDEQAARSLAAMGLEF